MLMGKENQMRTSAQKVIYPSSTFFSPPLSAPSKALTRLPSTEENTQASEILMMNVDF